MKSHRLSSFVNSASAGRVKYGWWTANYNSNDSPIILGGCSRSGTTLLQEMLGAHSRICIGPETAILTGNRKVEHIARVTRRSVEDIQRHLIGSNCATKFLENVMRDLMERNGKTRWGEKTPSNVRALNRLFASFPNARFIHIVRDGRDVVCSLRTHPKFEWRDGKHVETGIVNDWEKCIPEWVSDVKEGLSWRTHPGYYELRYESLVAEPESSMRMLLEWLGETWDPSTVDKFQTEKHVNHPGLNGPVYTSAVNRWESDLPRNARTLFRREGQELLYELGYCQTEEWIERAASLTEATV